MTESSRSQIESVAKYLESYTPLNTVEYYYNNITNISQLAYADGVKYIYEEIIEKGNKNNWDGPIELSEEYISNAEHYVKVSVASAGYHLADYLEYMFKNLNSKEGKAKQE